MYMGDTQVFTLMLNTGSSDVNGIQVNGKLRSKFMVSAGTDDETIKSTALADERIQKIIAGKEIRKVIVVKDKLVNIVV